MKSQVLRNIGQPLQTVILYQPIHIPFGLQWVSHSVLHRILSQANFHIETRVRNNSGASVGAPKSYKNHAHVNLDTQMAKL